MPTEPVRFAVVGSGWRIEFMLRLALVATQNRSLSGLVYPPR